MADLSEQEVAEAELRLRKVISRVVNQTPECFVYKNGACSIECRNAHTGWGRGRHVCMSRDIGEPDTAELMSSRRFMGSKREGCSTCGTLCQTDR
jgi:hypothetical protein